MAKHRFDCRALCETCSGTGLYAGIAERDGFAVVCRSCDGKGWRNRVFEYDDPLATRPRRNGVVRVLYMNPGIICGVGKAGKLTYESYGGMPYDDWLAGHPFPPKSEMREFTCPNWWYQNVDCGLKPEWTECHEGLGFAFSQCLHFKDKAKCWARFDAEHKE